MTLSVVVVMAVLGLSFGLVVGGYLDARARRREIEWWLAANRKIRFLIAGSTSLTAAGVVALWLTHAKVLWVGYGGYLLVFFPAVMITVRVWALAIYPLRAIDPDGGTAVLSPGIYTVGQPISVGSWGVSFHAPDPESEPVDEMWTPEPVIGWRFWALDPNTLTLQGAYGTGWSGPELKATHVGAGHTSPHPGCLCGINAYKARGDLGFGDAACVGRVALTGVVDEYERGYRASNGRILDLTILTSVGIGSCILDHMEARYGTRPRVMTFEQWTEETEESDGHWEEDSTDHQRTGTGEGAAAGTGAGAGQAVVTLEHSGPCCGRGVQISAPGGEAIIQMYGLVVTEEGRSGWAVGS